MAYSRQKVVDLVKSWEGKNEADGSYKEIIDIYNSLPDSQLPRRTKMSYLWAWCAATWSALAIALKYLAIMPIEMSCYYLIEAAKKMGIWNENDAAVPKAGDAILYDWDDNGSGNNQGTPDHVGTVTYVNASAGYMTVMEGNSSNRVKPRTISINGMYIRGFIQPKYDDNAVDPPKQEGGKSLKTVAHEVIAGAWGNGEDRKKALVAAGYNYDEVQAEVNKILNGTAAETKQPQQDQDQPVEGRVTATCYAQNYDASLAGAYEVTASDFLYCRNDAGTNKKALCKIPSRTTVQCYGYYNISGGVKWLYVQFTMDGVQYTGFSASTYLMKK